MEIDKNDEVYFEITDEDGVEHKVKLLTIFANFSILYQS